MVKHYDVVIVGAGPAGLSAAINGASEGLRVALLDAAMTLGGQARESARIENYPLPEGNQDGVTGARLVGGFVRQAMKFATDMINPMRAVRLEVDGDDRVVITDDHTHFVAPAVILSQGLSYRRHEARGMVPLQGRGVHYGMPPDLSSLRNCTVVIVGGANSAGQAVLRLAQIAGVKIKMVVRRPLEETMSSYLLERIRALDTVEELVGEVESVGGDARLREVRVRGPGGCTKIQASCLLLYIGAVPQTAWLTGVVTLDAKNFIVTGYDLHTPSKYPYETSVPGVFAVGDVRCGSTKRIVNAAGEGGAGLQSVHAYRRGLGV